MSQLQNLIDRAEIADLIAVLGRSLDEHRFDDMKEVFTEDVVGTTPGGTATGRDGLIEQARRNHLEFDRLQHQFSSVLVEFDGDGDSATVRANLVGTFGYAADPKPVRQLGAVYRCRTVRTGAGWRFAEFEVTSVWRHELAETPAA